MFEDYIEDAYNLALGARGAKNNRVAVRYYRAAVFYTVSAIEAFVNFVGETLEKGGIVEKYELAFLTDRKFGVVGGKFEIMSQMEFSRLDEKLKYLLLKYVTDYDMSIEASWPQFIEFKRFRDRLVHPREEEKEIGIQEYDKSIEVGLRSTIEIMDRLCKGVFNRGLRKKIVEMTL